MPVRRSLHSQFNVCKSLLRVKQLHAYLLKTTHFSQDPFYATQIIRLYEFNKHINYAYHVFDKTSIRTVYVWNSMIRAFAKTQRFRNAISLFRTMLQADIRPDNYTYACVIRACSDNFDFRMLRLVHGSSVSAGLGMNPICCSALVSAYSKLGFVNEACRVFNGIAEPDLVLWNSLISAYVCSGMWDIGIQMFSSMRHSGKKPDGFTLAGVLVGIADSSLLSIGQGLHGLSQKSGLDYDSHVGSLLVSMYSRCKCMDSAYRVFCSIFNPDLVTWSALIAGYSQCGEHQKVLLYFRKINMESKKPDSVLIATVLASIAQTAIVVPGCEVHGYVLRHGLESDVKVSSALIDMYSKCGFLHLGTRVFKIMPERNIISYNSVILALGLYGCASEAFAMLDEIMERGLVPDEATFSALLCACCHAGLVKDGREIFRRMKEEFNIKARPEHYVYMVKLLGSAGGLEEAYNLTQSLPEPVDKAILGALLSCCDFYGNSKLAETVAQQIFKSNPSDNVYKVMLSNIYAGDGRWDDAKKLRDKMTGGQKKIRGVEKKTFPSFESFIIEEEEGSGGYGIVYRAQRTTDGKRLAIKCPHSNAHKNHVNNERNMLERFGGKSFIIKFEGSLKSGNSECFVLEHFEHDRPEVLKKEIDISELQWYAFCMFKALACLHREGVVHRDVKPGNFLFSRKLKKGYLIDFNLAMDLKQKYNIGSKSKPSVDASNNIPLPSGPSQVVQDKNLGGTISLTSNKRELTDHRKYSEINRHMKPKANNAGHLKNCPDKAVAILRRAPGADGSGITSAKDITSTKTASADRLREPIPFRGRKELISLVQNSMQCANSSSIKSPTSQRKRVTAPSSKSDGRTLHLTPMPIHSSRVAVGSFRSKGDGKHKREGPCVGTKGFRAPEETRPYWEPYYHAVIFMEIPSWQKL